MPLNLLLCTLRKSVFKKATVTVSVTVLAFLTGCSGVESVHKDDRHYLQRAQTKIAGGFTVTAAALSIEESIAVFGAPLNNVGIQPVWLRIENDSTHPQWLFPIAVDADYFPPYEVARRMSGFSQLTEQQLFRKLNDQQMPNFIPEGSVSSGFVYAHADEGMKAFNIELHNKNEVHDFHFVVPVPGLPSRYFDLEDGRRYNSGEITDLDPEGLRQWLEGVVCCTSNLEGKPGDPLNVVFVGTLNQVRGALVSNQWDVTAPVSSGSVWRMMTAFVFGSRYRYAPISALYLFNREHDLAFQKARAVVDERNHMRLWLAPVTVKGVSVWVGQVSRDIGIKFSGRFWPPTTHLVDPDMDDARFYVLQEMVDSGSVSRLGFVKGHFTAGLSTPRQNAEDDPYFTDGLRAVFFMSEKPVSKPNIDIHPWELPSLMAPYRDRLLASPSLPSPAGTLERR